MPKAHEVTEAGEIVVYSGAPTPIREHAPFEWRQAIRTGLNHYWSRNDGAAFLKVTIRNDCREGRGERELFLTLFPSTGRVSATARFGAHASINLTPYVPLVVDPSVPDGAATALSRLAWMSLRNRSLALIVPVDWDPKNSSPIPDNKVTVWVGQEGILQLYAGAPPGI